MQGKKKKEMSSIFDNCHETASQEIFLRSCGFAQRGVIPDSDPSVLLPGASSPLNEIASRRDSQTDSVINSDYQEELVESHAVRFVSPPESPDTVDSEEDPTVPLQSANLLSSSPAKKRLKVPLRDVVKAIVMNSRSTEEDEDRGIEKKKKRSCVQILIEKGFNFP
ncbi:hypothetical protein Rs2_21586 [Raphanus sativus]|uniref:Uncharacterized protein LOC108831038 n=1 Tax=Raphanus sativus TaxID=3726 RepID=A0A6J0LL77_RAPSA|nr:uncharacterized protein LOC108831038 [Raphanus sativus]KAJ4894792.1 hypothetical protein Rs2_21586 [Raphanus sativus]